MRNAIAYTALAAVLTLGTVATGFAAGQGSTEVKKGEDTHMMDGSQMPMMDMQEMSKMVKNCNAMMENMNKHMGKEAPSDGSKAQ